MFNKILNSWENRAQQEANYVHWLGASEQESTPLIRYQNHRFKSLVSYAKRFSAFYNQSLPTIDNVSDISKLDTISRRTIRNRLDDLTVHGLPEYMYRNKFGTSGSTGEPIHFYCPAFGGPFKDIEERYIYHKLWRVLLSNSTSLEQVMKLVRIVEPSAQRYFDNPARLQVKPEDILLNAIDTVEKVVQFRPHVFACHASFTLAFCEALNKTPHKNTLHVSKIISTGELLLSEQRIFIENSLSGKVISRYGLEEFYWAVACEDTPYNNGLLSYGESYIIEILNEDGYSVEPGEFGEVTITDLNNYTMPLIRYRTGDIAKLIAHEGARTRFSLLGRQTKLLYGDKEVNYFTINNIFSQLAAAIIQYQFVKETSNRLTIMIVRNYLFRPDLETILLARVRSILGEQVAIEIKYVEKINRTKSGKTIVFVDRTTES
ncbi:MAG: phenylacetate--CoA ligase family protein [Candidatus Pacebacteria bacterium]|nr:phenylacetate--CoA ligase family protein [Candidatus Paceibacterota bacterium]